MRDILELLEIERECKGKGLFESMSIMLKSIMKDDYKESEMLVQDGIYQLLLHKMQYYPSVGLMVAEDGFEIFPHHFVKKRGAISKNTTITIDGMELSPFITLERAIEAEKLAIAQNRYPLLYLYVMASGYKGSVFDGIQKLFKAPANEEVLGQIKAYSAVFGQIGVIDVQLNTIKFATKEGKEKERVALTTNPDLSGGVAYAIPFQAFVINYIDA